MSRTLKTPFGNGSSGHNANYTLPFLIGWLESLANEEEDQMGDYSMRGQRWKRYELVMDAIDLLNQAAEMGRES